jgi:hypothetical protein
MRKQPRVPGTKDPKPNRAQRRHPEQVEQPETTPVAQFGAQPDLAKHASDDDVSVRAKSSGHGKKTADKWNQ